MDPMSTVMLGSMAIDYVKEPFQKAKDKRNLIRDIEAQRKRLNKNDNYTTNSTVNAIRSNENNKIEREALDIEASKEI